MTPSRCKHAQQHVNLFLGPKYCAFLGYEAFAVMQKRSSRIWNALKVNGSVLKRITTLDNSRKRGTTSSWI